MMPRLTWAVFASSLLIQSCGGVEEAHVADDAQRAVATEQEARQRTGLVEDLEGAAPNGRTAEPMDRLRAFTGAGAAEDPSRRGTRETTLRGQSAGRGDRSRLLERAEAGDPAAQLALGTASALGKEGVRNENQAVSWLTRAAEAGNLIAQYNLAILHIARGEMDDAYRWFLIAGERGSGPFQEAAIFNQQALALVLPRIDLNLATRDANDWMEEFDPNPGANLRADQELQFSTVLPISNDIGHGWRQKLADYQRAARDSLGWTAD